MTGRREDVKRIFIATGEPSGDLQGAYLAKALFSLEPGLAISGLGGRRMQDAGVNLLYDSSNWGAIGIFESLKRVPVLYGKLQKIKEELTKRQPDILVLIDFGAFNLRLAKFAKKLEIPTLYYFPPGSWSKDVRRAKQVADLVDKIVTPFPWSAEIYKSIGAQAYWFGHPLLDIVGPLTVNRERTIRLRANDSGFTVGLLPGSRKAELRFILPVLLKAAFCIVSRIKRAHFLLPLAPTVEREDIEKVMRKSRGARLKLRVVENATYDVMNASDLLILASGTAALEAAILRKPMIIVYRASYFTWLQYRLFFKSRFPFISLPNIIAGKPIVPELLQNETQPGKIADLAVNLLFSKSKLKKMQEDLSRIVDQLGSPGAVEKTAKLVLQMCQSH